MPNIVQLWDFEDGTTQGWSLGGNTVLDGSGALQGTYSLRCSFPSSTGASSVSIASISNIDLTAVSKPILIFLVKVVITRTTAEPRWNGGSVIVRINGTSDIRIILHDGSFPSIGTHTVLRVVAVDLSQWAGQTISIELIEYQDLGYFSSGDMYIDNIIIVDGADFEYNTGIVFNDNEDKTLEVSVPSADGDLSGITVDRFAICLATPDWKYSLMSAEAVTNQGSVKIDSTSNTSKHVNYTVPGTPPTSFQSLKIRVKLSVGAYDGWSEKIVVIFLNGWNYQRIYMFNVFYTANGVSPRYTNAVSTTTYGSSVTGSKDINVKIHGNKFSVALKVKYLVGDPSVVSVGSVTLTVYSSDRTTNYGSVSVDLKAGSEQVTTYITDLPTDTDLIFSISWGITASARIVLLIIPLIKVS